MKDNKHFSIDPKQLEQVLLRSDLKTRASVLASYCHSGQKDRVGRSYLSHLLEVADRAYHITQDERCYIVGLLHDILEDTNCPESFLRRAFGDEITDAVVVLTKQGKGTESESDAYFKRIKANPIARQVKIADLTHNANLCRFKQGEISLKDVERSQRYLARLKELMEGV